MLNKILTTPVDNLVELVKKNPNCTTSFLQTEMNLPMEIVEKWLVVLEEYKVIKVNYHGFEGFVNYVESEKDLDDKNKKAQEIDVNKLKDIFIQKAQTRNLSDEQMKVLWPKFVSSYQKDIRELFYKMAKDKGYDSYKIDEAWERYNKELLRF